MAVGLSSCPGCDVVSMQFRGKGDLANGMASNGCQELQFMLTNAVAGICFETQDSCW